MPKLRVWNIVNVPNAPGHYTVDSPESAQRLIHELAEHQLQQDWIESNAFGLEEWDEEAKEWCEWEDDNGNEILDSD